MADEPIASTESDRLGRADFAARMTQVLEHASKQGPSVVFGLPGPWGSGKTSVMRLVQREMSGDSSWRVVEFNPWEVSDLASLVLEFMLTVRSAVPETRRGKRLRSVLARYTRKVAPLTSVLAFTGIDPSRAVGALADAVGGDDSLASVREELTRQLAAHDQRILVLIDDVDRLQGDELALVLKLVRLVGRLPNLYYVLAYDEATVLDVLETTDVAKGQRPRALAYLDKIVQVRLDLPPVHPTRISALVDSALEQVVTQYSLVLSEADGTRLGRVYHYHLRAILREPRQVKRFFGQVDAMFPLVRDEVDFIDFLLITFLRTFFPQVHALLPRYKEELTGSGFDIGNRKAPPEERVKAWRERVSSALPGVDLDVVLGILGEAFPPIGNALAGRSGGSGGLAEERRVGSSEYFDRYFHLGVAVDDVSDNEVKAALGEVARGIQGAATMRVVERVDQAAEPLFDKLARFAPTDPESSRRLLPWALELQARAPERGLLGRSRIVASLWASEVLENADLTNPEEILALCVRRVGLEQVVAVTRRMVGRMRKAGQEPSSEQAMFASLVVGSIRDALERAKNSPLEASIEEVGTLLYGWRDLVGADPVRAWLHGAVDDAVWALEDVAALFVSVGRIVGTNIVQLSGWEQESFDEMLGTDFALQRFQPPTPLPEAHWHESVTATFEARRSHAIASLARLAQNRNQLP